MSNILYNRMRTLAKRLINKYGYKKVKYIQQSVSNSSWKGELSSNEYTTDCLILPSQKYSKETYHVNGSFDIADSNYTAFIPYSDFIPTINDLIITQLKEFTIVSVIEISPDGDYPIIFKLELK